MAKSVFFSLFGASQFCQHCRLKYYVLVAHVAVQDLSMSNPLVVISFPPVGMTKQVRFTLVHAELVLEMPSHLHVL